MPTPQMLALGLLAALSSASALGLRVGKDCVAGCAQEGHCQKCAGSGEPSWSCALCCPGYHKDAIAGGYYCTSKGPSPPPPSGNGTYICKGGKCYESAFGAQSKTACEASCGGPAPPPGPPPLPADGPDTWADYEVGGMAVRSVVGGKNASNYQKVVVMLHGGDMTGYDCWQYNYQQGWFGDPTGIKYVFPTSPTHLWYQSYKIPGCGLDNDCAYNLSSISESADRVDALIEHEKQLVGGDPSSVYLAGFSQGGQLTSYMQLAKLDYALGGTIVLDGYPLPPLVHMPSQSPAVAKMHASYFGQDMKFFLWWGEDDPIFTVGASMRTFSGIFDSLGITRTLKVNHTEPGMGHTLLEKEIRAVVEFVRTGGTEA